MRYPQLMHLNRLMTLNRPVYTSLHLCATLINQCVLPSSPSYEVKKGAVGWGSPPPYPLSTPLTLTQKFSRLYTGPRTALKYKFGPLYTAFLTIILSLFLSNPLQAFSLFHEPVLKTEVMDIPSYPDSPHVTHYLFCTGLSFTCQHQPGAHNFVVCPQCSKKKGKTVWCAGEGLEKSWFGGVRCSICGHRRRA